MGAVPPERDDLMARGDEAKLERCAATDAERERTESRSRAQTIWQWCGKFLDLSRQFTVLSRGRYRIGQKLSCYLLTPIKLN
jgi:hypothetical protein